MKSAENAKTPVNIALLNSQKAVQIAAGYAHSVVLSSKVCTYICFHRVYSWMVHVVRVFMNLPESLPLFLYAEVIILVFDAEETWQVQGIHG